MKKSVNIVRVSMSQTQLKQIPTISTEALATKVFKMSFNKKIKLKFKILVQRAEMKVLNLTLLLAILKQIKPSQIRIEVLR